EEHAVSQGHHAQLRHRSHGPRVQVREPERQGLLRLRRERAVLEALADPLHLPGRNMARDHYEVLGLPRRYHLDAAELEQRYLALQKETHPDRFAKALPRERLEAVVRNTELNDAYKILK